MPGQSPTLPATPALQVLISHDSHCKYPSNWPPAHGRQVFLAQEGESKGSREWAERTPGPSHIRRGSPQSWGLGLPFALGLVLKEKRLIRRREKLPAFFRTLGVVIVLERSSWDWLRPASFCRGLRRKMSLVPLRRKLTL